MASTDAAPTPSPFLQPLSEMCEDGDVVLKCADGEMKAHATLLALHSPVLKARVSARLGSGSGCTAVTRKRKLSEGDTLIITLEPTETVAEWTLILAAMYLPADQPGLFTLENSYKMTPLAHRYQMHRVLHMMGHLGLCTMFQKWEDVQCAWQENTPSTGRHVIFNRQYDHPHHLLNLLNLAHGTGHPNSCELLQSVMTRFSPYLHRSFDEAVATTTKPPHLLQSSALAILAACKTHGLIKERLTWDGSLGTASNSNAPGTLHAALQDVLAEGDMLLDCKPDGQRVRVHKFMLCMHSPVLKDMLDCSLQQQQAGDGAADEGLPVLPVDDDSASWLALLLVLYPLPDDGGCAAHMVPTVMRLADKYGITKVRAAVVQHWLVPAHFSTFLAAGTMTDSKMLDVLCSLSHCGSSEICISGQSGYVADTVLLCQILLRKHAPLLLHVLTTTPADKLPALSHTVWWTLAKHYTSLIHMKCPMHPDEKFLAKDQVVQRCSSCNKETQGKFFYLPIAGMLPQPVPGCPCGGVPVATVVLLKGTCLKCKPAST